MPEGDTYREFIKPVWDLVNIYESPDVFAETFGRVKGPAGFIRRALLSI